LVRDLLEGDPIDWNSQLIQNLFLPVGSTQITQLPIIHFEREDELMWMFDKEGNYIVKTEKWL